MFVETVRHRIRLVRPRSFAGLMALYESNHVRLRQLLGNLTSLAPRLVSQSANDLALHVTCEARSRYTTTLRMTYVFEPGDNAGPEPDLLLRIYHDARLVEALSCCDEPQHALVRRLLPSDALAAGVPTLLRQRWALNILLHKWLEYCLDCHHSFHIAVNR